MAAFVKITTLTIKMPCMQERILHIAIPTPLDQRFDYLLPYNYAGPALTLGQRVRVPFGRRLLVGILIGTSAHSDIASNKLKPILEVLDDEPVLCPALFALCQFAATYYHYPLGELFALALPRALRQGKACQPLTTTAYRLTHQGLTLAPAALTRAPKQAALLALLRAQDNHTLDARVLRQTTAAGVITSCTNKGWIEKHESLTPATATTAMTSTRVTLNTAQQYACQRIQQVKDRFNIFLLHGITGSGKTEVYLHCIEEQLSVGKQALVLVPEIALTPQTVARFRAFFPTHTIEVLHSGLTDSARLGIWCQCRAATIAIVIGTRSAIFTPLPKLGIIIVDEEHDLSFKQQDSLRYCARDLAIKRAKDANIPIVLGSATPSLESYYQSQQGRYQYISLPARTGKANPPTFSLIDLRQQPLIHGLAPRLIEAIGTHLQRAEQVLLFINRRGFAPTVLCHSCGWVAHCPHCDAHLVKHHAKARLQCHHCGFACADSPTCPDCASSQLLAVGAGTERVEQALSELFPHIPLIRIDKDSTKQKGSLSRFLAQIHTGGAQILVGTQLLAKGHHFPNVTLVGILNADHGLYSCDFRASELMGQLLLQVAGRAGRADKPGHVYIQTHHPDHPVLNCLLQQGYSAFANLLLAERQAACLPPFSYLALIHAETKQANQAMAFLQQLKRMLPAIAGLECLGPAPALMQKRQGYYRAQLLLQAQTRIPLHQGVDQIQKILSEIKSPPGLRLGWDIDPKQC
jgi:primosomal protein N' (replication factor Y) (superfamily II helicase)